MSSCDACNVKIKVKQVCYVTPRPSKIEASHVCGFLYEFVRKNIYTNYMLKIFYTLISIIIIILVIMEK